MKPIERVYYQLINGEMYPGRIRNGKLEPVINEPLNTKSINNKSDTVTPKFSIEEDGD